ncbi:MAG: alpha/beta fold hydrolase [Thiohalobacterales bacterium]|nr:alpha/beta fold hydrolase [Thiohalobacterales bacterium]
MKKQRTPRFAILLALIPLMLLNGCSITGGIRPKAAETTAEPRLVDLFYITDRAPDAESGRYFGGKRGDLSYGVSHISIPAGHVMGQHEEPSLLKFEWTHEEGKHINVRDVLRLTQEEFTSRLGEAIEASPGKKVMVFVHGYNEEFAETSRMLAQFALDLKFSGPVILFSWPSQGSLTGYTVDETNAQWAQSHFLQMLSALLEQVPAQNIYLVGHSMGNRIIGNAMITLASERLESDLLLFREIVMIAPDIDADVFRREMAPRLARTGIHITLYASSKDRALLASKAFHGYPRAGESGESLVVVKGVETIDASVASGGLLGHSYYAEDRRIMEDIFGMLQTGQRADQRFGLEAIETGEGRYWTFRK